MNTDIEKLARKVKNSEEMPAVVQEMEKIIKSKKSKSYGWPTNKVEYLKNLKRNRNLQTW